MNFMQQFASLGWLDRRRNQYILLVGITLFAFLLRFYKLGTWSLWIDEIYTSNRVQAHYGNLALTVQNLPPHIKWVPVSLLATAGAFEQWGVSAWSVRVAPALIGVATIPILYFPVAKLFNEKTSLIAALLLAVSPWHVEWSQNGRFYTALLLFYTLALLSFYFGLERDRPWYLLLGFGFAYLALSERLIAFFLGPVILLYLLLLWILPLEKPAGLRKRNLALILLPGLLLVAVDIGQFLFSGQSMLASWLLLSFSQPIEDPLRLGSFIFFALGIPLITLAGFSGLYLITQRHRAGLLLLVSAVLPVGMLLLLNPFIFTKPRYAFVTLTSWIILGATAVVGLFVETRGKGKLFAAAILFIFLLDAAGAHLLYFHVNHGNRHDWKTAFATVNENLQNEDVVVTWWPEFGPYYLPETEILPWKEVKQQTVRQSDHRYWFVLDSETIWGNEEMKWWVENHAELIDVLALRTFDDNTLYVYLYDPIQNPPTE